MIRNRLVRSIACALTAGCLASPALAALSYQADLGPMPLDDQSKPVIQGRGTASATLDGKTLTVTGTFAGLVSPATGAHVFLGPAIGVPGARALNLTVTQATSGAVSGSASLTGAQQTAFRTGRLYIQIDSTKAPDGNLWGWILPAHDRAGQDVPQAGHWFIPQLDTPAR